MLDQLVSVDIRALVVFAMVFLMSSWYFSVRLPGMPPGPLPVPILGVVNQFAFDNLCLKWRKKYGDIFMLFIGRYRVFFVCGLDNVKELLTRTGDEFINRPKLYLIGEESKGGKGVMHGSGARWKENRRATLLSIRDFGIGRLSLYAKVIEEATAFCQLLKEHEGKATNMQPILTHFVSNVICSVLFGRRFEFGDPEFSEATAGFGRVSRRYNTAAMLDFFPLFRFTAASRRALNDVHGIEGFIRRKIAEQRSTYNPHQPPRNFTDLYLQVEYGESDFDSRKFDEEHLYATIRDLFSTGTDTMAILLLWAVLYLSLNEDAQQRCREEIFSVVGRDGVPEMQHRRSMPFLEATLLEVQRLGDVVSLGGGRCAVKDTMFHGFRVPKDTVIFPFFHSVHRDEMVFPEPEKFLPERWLDAEKRPMMEEHLIAFSMGRRNCLAESLAKMELFLFVTIMLQKYSFSIPAGQPRPSIHGIVSFFRTPMEFSVLVAEVK